MSSERAAGALGRSGIIFVISAPSGAGKTSLCKELIDFFPTLRHSVSYTTRPARPGEVDGVDYHFVTGERFRAMVGQGAFAEWAEVHGNCYGTALASLEAARAAGEDILLDIDCQGAEQLRNSLGHGVFIFILPPDMDELRRRLIQRNTDSDSVIAQRLANAQGEIDHAPSYDYLVVNDDFALALSQLKAIIVAEGLRTRLVLPTLRNRFDFQPG
jgi:guanylate kinase